MAKLYCDANPKRLAYYIEGSGVSESGSTDLPGEHDIMQAEYLAIIYGLNQYFLAWNKELDARQSDLDTEKSRAVGESVFHDVATPGQRTARPLPPAVLVLTDNEVVAKQLSRQYHIGNDKLRRLADRVWQMTKGVEVKYQWVPRRENIAGKMLK